MALSKEFRQELFDEGALAILKQGAPCRGPGTSSCAYTGRSLLTGEERHCIVGWLLHNRGILPSELTRGENSLGVGVFTRDVDPGFRGDRDEIEVLSWLVALGAEDREDFVFLQVLQSCHDTMGVASFPTNIERFKEQMRVAAAMYGLDPKVVA